MLPTEAQRHVLHAGGVQGLDRRSVVDPYVSPHAVLAVDRLLCAYTAVPMLYSVLSLLFELSFAILIISFFIAR